MSARSKSSSLARLARTLKRYFSLKNIFTREDRRVHLNWREILCGIALAILVCWLLDRVGRFDLSRPVIAIIGSVFIALKLRWHLRNRLWFWLTIIVYLALSGVLTSALTWSTEGPSRPIIGGFMGISVYFLFVVLHAFDRHFQRASSISSERPNQPVGHQP